MAQLRWTEAMSVGVPELDADHKVLIDVINRLEAGAKAGADGQAVRRCLTTLMRYAEFHFAREEKVMSACHFVGLEGHRAEHRDFIKRVRRFADRCRHDPAAVVGDQLLDFLKDWLQHHILIQDMAYRPGAEGSLEARRAARSFSPLEVWWNG